MNKMKPFKLYDENEKLKIIQDHLENKIPIRACAAKHNVATTSIVMWLRAYRDHGKEGLKSQIRKKKGKGKGRPIGTFKPKTTIEELERENIKLRIEIERLKKVILRKELGQERNSFL